MSEHEAVRTLVKSPPELWEVCSDAGALGRHLQAFGEIRITRTQPEQTVAWEGERVCGTVELEAAGWGTRVRLRASPTGETDYGAPEAPPPAVPRAGWRRIRLISRVFRRRRGVPPGEADAATGEGTEESMLTLAVLYAALDSLGQAHHRPFSRA